MRKEDSTAYDYSRFEQNDEKSVPVIKKVASKKQQRSISILRVLIYIFAGFGMIGGLLYCKATQVELESKYSQKQKEINQVRSENTRLQIELESKLSLKNIEEIARNDMGLEKIDDQKIEYINFNEYDKVEILYKKNIWDKAADIVSGMFE